MTFVGKTYDLVSNIETDNLISWDRDGTTFIVHNPERLAAEVFSKFFNHTSYPSFTRALNAYGFRQVTRNRWKHPDFRRGDIAALDNIQRRRPAMRKTSGSKGLGPMTDESPGGFDAQPPVQLELHGFNAQGCTQLIESQRTMLMEVGKEIAELRNELQVARAEDLRMRSAVTQVLGHLVQEYGTQVIEAALGCAHSSNVRLAASPRGHLMPPLLCSAARGPLEAFMQHAETNGMQRAATEWLETHSGTTPRITFNGFEEHAHGGQEGTASGEPQSANVEQELSRLLKTLGVETRSTAPHHVNNGMGSDYGGKEGMLSVDATHGGESVAPDHGRFEEIEHTTDAAVPLALGDMRPSLPASQAPTATDGLDVGGKTQGSPSSPEGSPADPPTHVVQQLFAAVAAPDVQSIVGEAGASAKAPAAEENLDILSSLRLDDLVDQKILES